MEICINNLKQAVKSIDEKYFKRNERDFTYELYHKLRSHGLPKDIEVTCETPKMSYRIPATLLSNRFFIDNFFVVKNIDFETKKFRRTPDLLFHKYKTKQHQKLAVEIKPLNAQINSIKTDIAKLMFYTESVLKYEKCILILFGRSNDNLINTVKSRISEPFNNGYSKIEVWVATHKKVVSLGFD